MSVLRSYTPQISRRIPQVDRSVRLFQLAAINVMRQEPNLRNLRALLVDAAGTLIYPAQNVAKVLQRCKFQYIVNFDISVDSSPGSLDLLYHAPWIPSCIKNSTSVALLRVDIKPRLSKLPYLELKCHLLPQVYLDHARLYGCKLSEEEVLANFWRAFNTPWTRSVLRYEGDGWPFWFVLGAFCVHGDPMCA